MPRSIHAPRRGVRRLPALLAATLALAACGDQLPIEAARTPMAAAPSHSLQELLCTATRTSVSCSPARQLGGRGAIVGNQGTNVKLTSSNVNYDAVTDTFSFDVTVQNLMNESIGTPDGVVADTNGIRVFFNSGPSVTVGSGEVTVANADGTDAFTASNQPYFQYNQILAKDQVSDAHTWKLIVPEEAASFTFTLFVESDIQYLLVVNELLVNPAGTTIETNGDWVEVYNAGSLKVDMKDLVIADSAASGRRPYHLINQSLVVQPGAYVVLGTTTNTANNGGATVDYSWGGAVNLSNSLDAFKIARVYGTDTLTIDRTQYAQASLSAQDGVSRELKNPALDNSNMDGSNWGSASATAVYGSGGRGTPKAQNSVYTP
jgi:hypothetical protein